MEKMNDLRDLLKHEIMDLYSVEEQIIEALPQMIEKAGNANLKKLLQEHLKVTEKQKGRLDRVKQILGEGEPSEGEGQQENRWLFSRLFGGGGEQKCKGMEGILKEGQKIMGEEMNPEVRDAAIIGAAQKVEHYEICGYGTARAYSRELMMDEITQLLEESLNEEYDADDNLTVLAVGRLNVEAELAAGDMGDDSPLKERGASRNNNGITRGQNKNTKAQSNKSNGKSSGGGSKGASSQGRGSSSKTGNKAAAGKSSTNNSGSRGGSSSNSKGATKGGSKGASKGASKAAGKGASKGSGKATSSKGATKGGSKGASKGASKSSASKSASKSSGNKSGAKGKNKSRSRR